jgi:hypothetical protein
LGPIRAQAWVRSEKKLKLDHLEEVKVVTRFS